MLLGSKTQLFIMKFFDLKILKIKSDLQEVIYSTEQCIFTLPSYLGLSLT